MSAVGHLTLALILSPIEHFEITSNGGMAMIEIEIPGFKHLELAHLVLDFNGTLAVDGTLIGGVVDALAHLSQRLLIHVVTADTFGSVQASLQAVACQVVILASGNLSQAKQAFVGSLGSRQTVAIGNGRNDRLMLQEAALGIAVIQEEGAFSGTLQAADVVCGSIVNALNLLTHPLRLVATLRN
jgi:soluble P-type ATPase